MSISLIDVLFGTVIMAAPVAFGIYYISAGYSATEFSAVGVLGVAPSYSGPLDIFPRLGFFFLFFFFGVMGC